MRYFSNGKNSAFRIKICLPEKKSTAQAGHSAQKEEIALIGILTFHWADNHGAMLQTYALKHYLEKRGEQVRVIPYAPYWLTCTYWLCPFKAELEDHVPRYQLLRESVRWNLRVAGRFERRRLRMRAFRRRYLTSEAPIRKTEDLSFLPFKSVVIGSDQVWNPKITLGLADAYTGNIPQRGNCRLISYAASFGEDALPEADREEFIRRVGGFHAVSVREEAGAAFARQLLGREVCHALDPTLLLDRTEWEKIGKVPPEKDYVLLYMMPCREHLLRWAQAFAARLGKKLIALANPGSTHRLRNFEPASGVGPAEFIGYVQNAYCVLTSSFHGTVFSILYEKPFLTYCQDVLGNRQRNLLERLGLLSHLWELDKDTDPAEVWKNTDWEQVRSRLSSERERSERFLAENI
jgi:hypothetical protein